MVNELSGAPLEMQGRSMREGKEVATISAEARSEAEKILNNPFLTWDEMRMIVPIFITESSTRIILQGISYYEQLRMPDGRHLRPLLCPNFYNFYKDTFYQELQLRVQYGKSNISAVGFLQGIRQSKGRSWHRIASGEGYLIQGFKGGQDATWYGMRGSGKTDACLHYYVLPFLKEGNHVVSGIEIANNDDWENYVYCTTNADLLIESCNIIIDYLTNKGYMPNIMVVRDDISASGISRKRAMSEELFNLECLGMITRHYGIRTVWIFQYRNSIPTSIMDATTRWINKTHLKGLTSTIEWARGTEITKITGLTGLDDRKSECADSGKVTYLDYDCQKPQITVDNLPMSEAMMYLNYKERNKKLKPIERFTLMRDYLQKRMELGDMDRAITDADVIRAIVNVYVLGKKKKKLSSIPLTMGGLAKTFNQPHGKVRHAIEKAVEDYESNPDRWIPLPENKSAQRNVVEDALSQG